MWGGPGGWVWGYQVSTLEGYVCISSRGPPLPLPLDLEVYSRAAQEMEIEGMREYNRILDQQEQARAEALESRINRQKELMEKSDTSVHTFPASESGEFD